MDLRHDLHDRMSVFIVTEICCLWLSVWDELECINLRESSRTLVEKPIKNVNKKKYFKYDITTSNNEPLLSFLFEYEK